jgi:hypothetical protein
LHGDFAAVRLDDRLHDAQSQAIASHARLAAAGRIDAEKAAENQR